MLEKNNELRAEDQATQLGWLNETMNPSHTLQTGIKIQPLYFFVPYLVARRELHDHGEAVVIGGRVAEDVHDGSHLLYSVQTRHWGTHHLPG